MAAAVLIALWYVVLGAESTDRGKPTFCHHVDDVPILRSTPCVLIDIGVMVSTMAGLLILVAAFVMVWKGSDGD